MTKTKTKFSEHWKTLFKTPGPARIATVVMLVMWAMAAVWGWFFVEPTVLRDSQAARDFVDFATKVFPWLDNIRKLGPQAEKGLFLHCVYFFALAPIGLIGTAVTMSSAETKKLLAAETPTQTFLSGCFCFVLLFLIIWGMYSYILQPSFGRLHRTGYSFVVSSITAPISGPFFIIGFWSIVLAGVHSVYHTVCKLISKE